MSLGLLLQMRVLSDDLDLLEGAVHPADEPLLLELVGESDHGGAVAVAVPAAGLADRHHHHVVHAAERDDLAVGHPQQVVDVAYRLPLEGDPDLARSLKRLLHCLLDHFPHRIPPCVCLHKKTADLTSYYKISFLSSGRVLVFLL